MPDLIPAVDETCAAGVLSHGWPVFASANRIPPDSASPNVVLSGSGETAGQ